MANMVRALASQHCGPGLFSARCHLWVEFVVATASSCLMLEKALTFRKISRMRLAQLVFILFCFCGYFHLSVFVFFVVVVVVAVIVFLSIPKEPWSQVRTLLKNTTYTGLENFK